MILDLDADKDCKPSPAPVDRPSDDPPPIYTPLSPAFDSSPVVAFSQSHTLDSVYKTNPSNFVSIDRKNGSMTGSWLVDPNLLIPLSSRPPLETGETEQTRRNINLKTSNGCMDFDISLAPLDPNVNDTKVVRRRTTLYARSSNGSVKMKLHAAYTAPRLPFYLHVHSSNGGVTISIPRSFRGLLVLKTSNGSHQFSADALTRLTTFSEVHGTRKCFIGNYCGTNEEWQGDEVSVETTNGSITIFYEDEASEPPKPSKPAFFGRLLGR